MTKRSFAIRPFRAEDYPQVQDIYEQGLITGNASYEHRPLTLDEFNDGKILDTVYVAVEENDDSKVIGWVSGAHISQREVLAGVVEDSIYIDPQAQGRGIAGGLLDKFIEVCQEKGMWAIHSWIFPENDGSAKLHASRGFEKVGTYKHLAKMITVSAPANGAIPMFTKSFCQSLRKSPPRKSLRRRLLSESKQ